MKKACILLIIALSTSAHADGPYRGGYTHHGGHGGGSDWAGLAIFGTLLGLAIMSENARTLYADPYNAGPWYPPQPIYPDQQLQMPPASGNPAPAFHYCASSRMYYPYTRACPEGWQLVPATPY